MEKKTTKKPFQKQTLDTKRQTQKEKSRRKKFNQYISPLVVRPRSVTIHIFLHENIINVGGENVFISQRRSAYTRDIQST